MCIRDSTKVFGAYDGPEEVIQRTPCIFDLLAVFCLSYKYPLLIQCHLDVIFVGKVFLVFIWFVW